LEQVFETVTTALLPYVVERPESRPEKLSGRRPFVFAYGGRLVRSKGVDLLIETFDRLNKKYPNARLELFGEAHFRNYILHGIHQNMEAFTAVVSHYMAKNKNINWHKGLSPKEFQKKLNDVDCFVSLSTYHDEDFGVSFEQALNAGCRLIGTNWGGHKDILDLQPHSKGIAVHRGTDGLIPSIKKEDVFDAMETCLLENKAVHRLEREDLNLKLNEIFGQDIKPFVMGKEFQDYGYHFYQTNQFPFQKRTPTAEYFYEKYYRSYYWP